MIDRFAALAVEVQLGILAHCEPADLVTLARAAPQLEQIAFHGFLWKRTRLRDVPANGDARRVLAVASVRVRELDGRDCQNSTAFRYATRLCPHVESLKLNTFVHHLHMAGIGAFKYLGSVEISSYACDPDIFFGLANSCRKLRSLSVTHCKIICMPTHFREALDILFTCCAEISSVSFAYTPAFRDYYLGALGACTALESLNLSGCPLVTDDGLDDMGRCESLTQLKLSECPLITLREHDIAARFPNLAKLDASFCVSLNSVSLGAIHRLDALVTLNLEGCARIGSAGVLTLVASIPTLATLSLADVDSIRTDHAIEVVRSCHSLAELSLDNCYLVADELLEFLISEELIATRLRKLSLLDCRRMSYILLSSLAKKYAALTVVHFLLTDLGRKHVLDNPSMYSAEDFRKVYQESSHSDKTTCPVM